MSRLLKLLNTILPHQCHLCNKKTEHPLCQQCLNTIKIEQNQHRINNISVHTLVPYKNPIVRNIFKEIKFNHNQRLTHYFSEYLSDQVLPLTTKKTVFIPVPSHKKRIQNRGFSHINLLYKALIRTKKISYAPLLKRTKNTKSLSKLSPIERQIELKQSIELNPDYDAHTYRELSICLVDDIVTTGETLNICSKILKQAGFTKISALAIANAHT
jgi:competence protein ComFC